jgi:hypothetical protein
MAIEKRSSARSGKTVRCRTNESAEPATGLTWNWNIQISEKVLIALITVAASFASGMAYETVRADSRSPNPSSSATVSLPQSQPAVCPILSDQ